LPDAALTEIAIAIPCRAQIRKNNPAQESEAGYTNLQFQYFVNHQ
jgi:hypothetical protein